jgi:hypothetical protein
MFPVDVPIKPVSWTGLMNLIKTEIIKARGKIPLAIG